MIVNSVTRAMPLASRLVALMWKAEVSFQMTLGAMPSEVFNLLLSGLTKAVRSKERQKYQSNVAA